MKLPGLFKSGIVRIGGIILLISVLLYLSLRLFFFETDPLIPLIDSVFSQWIEICGRFAGFLLDAFGMNYRIEGSNLLSGNTVIYEFKHTFLMRKVFFGLLIFFWLFPVKVSRKIIASTALIIVHSLFTSVDMVILASLLSSGGIKSESAYLISRTPAVMMLISIFVIWVLRFKSDIYRGLRKLNVDIGFIDRKLPDLFVVMYLYGFIGNFLLGWYDYKTWINFLFLSSQNILEFLGYESIVYQTYLLGENGSIYMEKGCLGFATMMLFAAVVYLTSEKGASRWIYILLGLIFLNFVNIIRFVFLFIHIQKNNGYVLAMDVHDMYNLVLYGVVFILWIIWFEFFVLKNIGRAGPGDADI